MKTACKLTLILTLTVSPLVLAPRAFIPAASATIRSCTGGCPEAPPKRPAATAAELTIPAAPWWVRALRVIAWLEGA